MSKFDIAQLADGKSTDVEIAEILGVSPKYIRRVARELALPIVGSRRPMGRPKGDGAKTVRELAAKGMFARDIAAAMGLARRTVWNIAHREGIELLRPPPTPPTKKREPKARPPAPPKPQTIAEWLAIHGAPRKFEAGTLDQLLADTLASAGKTLTYSAGKGTSWRPYRLGKRDMNRAQVIAEANKIRAAQGKPLFTAPKRQAPVGSGHMPRRVA